MAEYGYGRVSSTDQNLDRQIEELKEAGLNERYIYCDKVSGKNFDRPSYNLLVGTEHSAPLLREGDLLIFTSLDRMGRNYEEIKTEWRRLTLDLKVDIRILDMPLLDTRTENVSVDKRFICNLIFEVLSYFAEKERAHIRKQQRKGIDTARKRGKRLGRPKINYPENWDEIYKSWQDGKIKAKEAMALSGLKAGTFYNLVKQYESEKGLKRKIVNKVKQD